MNNTLRVLSLLVVATVALASPISVTFNGPQTGANNGVDYVGPYSLIIDGDTSFGICITDYINIYPGQTWLAEELPITDFSDAIYTKLLEAEWLNQRWGLTSDWSGVHQAIWDIFDPGKFTDTNTLSWLAAAQSHYTSVNPTSFYVLVPEPNFQINEGVSQTFLINGHPTTLLGVPEPASFMLFGTGLVLLGIVRRNKHRFKNQK